MTNDDLDMIPTDDLMAALTRRFDAHLCVLVKDRGNSSEERGLYYSGGLITSIGMARWAEIKLLEPDGTERVDLEPDDE